MTIEDFLVIVIFLEQQFCEQVRLNKFCDGILVSFKVKLPKEKWMLSHQYLVLLFGCSDSIQFLIVFLCCLIPSFNLLWAIARFIVWTLTIFMFSAKLITVWFLRLLFFYFSSIFRLLNRVSEATIDTPPLTVQDLCYLRDAMLYHYPPDTSNPLPGR